MPGPGSPNERPEQAPEAAKERDKAKAAAGFDDLESESSELNEGKEKSNELEFKPGSIKKNASNVIKYLKTTDYSDIASDLRPSIEQVLEQMYDKVKADRDNIERKRGYNEDAKLATTIRTSGNIDFEDGSTIKLDLTYDIDPEKKAAEKKHLLKVTT